MAITEDEIEFSETTKAKRREMFRSRLELGLWLAISSGATYLLSLAFAKGGATAGQETYTAILVGSVVMLFPLIFNIVVGALPGQFARHFIARKWGNKLAWPSSSVRDYQTMAESELTEVQKLAGTDSTSLLAKYAYVSRLLSDRIHSRSMVYLFAGAMIAASGLVFFYIENASSKDASDGMARIFSLAPRFGILLFIELVAFFFLKQYRATMDEFRYYESVARRREESFLMVRLAKESGQTNHILEMIKSGMLSSRIDALNKGQTTELLESRKLEGSELELLEKVVETISRARR